ncbi:MAG: hypothetical protein HXY50_07990 [Ignavibacteriaceae bacterium]|nr:hypothetical protein [Ignavibacteriaceae bacterium]
MRILIVFAVSLLAFCEITLSLPRFALKEKSSCIDCHVNPTGGIIRNRGGWSYSKNMISMISPREDFKMNNKIGENIQFGFDARGQYLLQMTDSTKKTDFQKMNASLYTNVDLSDNISFVARYDFLQNIWEGYGIIHIIPEIVYLKGGTFSPNFGVRLDDHTAYTRGGDFGLLFTSGIKQGLIYNPMYTESGIEAGLNINDLLFLTTSVGNQGSALFAEDPSFTANLKVTPQLNDEVGLFLGGSFGIYRDRRSTGAPLFKQISPQVQMYGGYLGIGYSGFTLIAEFDFANEYLAKDVKSAFSMVEASYAIIKGLDAVIRWDRFDPNTKSDNSDLNRYIIGFEFFPYSFIEIRPQYRIQSEKPSVTNNSALIQFHIWY